MIVQKLEQVVKDALLSRDVAEDNVIFKSCAQRLYAITKSYVKVSVIDTLLYVPVHRGQFKCLFACYSVVGPVGSSRSL